jgi:hypothetical protein
MRTREILNLRPGEKRIRLPSHPVEPGKPHSIPQLEPNLPSGEHYL